MTLVLPGLVVIALAAFIVRRRPARKKSEVEAFVEKWQLPDPGGDFRLYRRVKKLLDELEAERDEARLEREVARRAYEESLAEQNRLAAKLEAAQDMLRTWMHPKMEIRVKPRVERRRVQWIL